MDAFRELVVSARLPRIWTLLLLAALPLAAACEPDEHAGRAEYHSPKVLITLTCQAGGHPYTPQGPPPPPDRPEEFEGWLLSGEPECLPLDLLSDNGSAGFGGVAYVVQDREGQLAVLRAVDDHFGARVALEVRFGPDAAVRVCGAGEASGVIGQPVLRANIRPVDQDPTTGELCGGTRGVTYLDFA